MAQEFSIAELRQFASHVKGWGCTAAWANPEDEGMAFVGSESDGQDRQPVMEVNTGLYFQEKMALPLAQFYAAASPVAVIKLIDQIETLQRQLAMQNAVVEQYAVLHAPISEEDATPASPQVPDPNAVFIAQQKFFAWVHNDKTGLVAKPFEFSIFNKVLELYFRELYRASPPCPVPTEDLLDAIWILMGNCDSAADNNDDRVLKHQVEGYYSMYSRAVGREFKPSWIRRAEQIAREQQANVTNALHLGIINATPKADREQMATYLRAGAEVEILKQNEVTEVGEYAISVKGTDFWITCCDSDEHARVTAKALGLNLAN